MLIDDKLYTLVKDSEIAHKPIFDAITRGIPIQTELMRHNEMLVGNGFAETLRNPKDVP